MEKCDRPQGFQVVHSLGGGTGAGLGARVVEGLRREYPGLVMNTFSVIPSSRVPGSEATATAVAEPFNALWAMARLVDGADNTYFADNDALLDACTGHPLRLRAPAYADLNHLVAYAMSGVTTAFRLPGPGPYTDMRTCTTNMVPYRKLHFFVPEFAPLTYRGQSEFCAYTVPELIEQLSRRDADAHSPPVSCNGGDVDGRRRRPSSRHVTMAATFTFRGRDLCAADVRAHVARSDRPAWIPNNVKTAAYHVPSCGLHAYSSATLVANTTAVGAMFDGIRDRCVALSGEKRFLRLFADEGATADDYREARNQIQALVAEYRSLEDAHCADDLDPHDDLEQHDDLQPHGDSDPHDDLDHDPQLDADRSPTST